MTGVMAAPGGESLERSAPTSPGRWVLAAALLGAAAIHLALAPTHLDASVLEGAGFIVAAWLQVGLAVCVVARPTRGALVAVVITNGVLIALWAWSRTIGLPAGAHAGEAEAVSFVDAACVALELVGVVVAGLLLWERSWVALASTRVAVGGMVAVVALATAAVASPSVRDHGRDGHHAADPPEEHAHEPASSEAADDLGFASLQNGQMGSHEHGDDPGAGVEPTSIDPVTAGALAEQLAQTAALVRSYPTIADARAAGFRQAGPFAPGLGIHYSRGFAPNSDGVMDPEDVANPYLIYDGVADDAPLAGFMYMAYQETEPEGFAGDLDRWHYHTAVCIVTTPTGIDTPFGADLTGVTEEMCQAKGGSLIDFTGYMVHVWTVPGYESSLGTFSDLNPRITCPDGTYHTIPITEIGDADSTCADP